MSCRIVFTACVSNSPFRIATASREITVTRTALMADDGELRGGQARAPATDPRLRPTA